MSFEATLVDALLAKITASLVGVTTRNAISSGFKPEAEVPPTSYPFAQGFSVSYQTIPGNHGQLLRRYSINCFIAAAPGPGSAETLWTSIDALRSALAADYSLAGTVKRAWIAECGVDEVGDVDRERVLAGFIFQAEVL